MDGTAPKVCFTVNNKNYDMGYYLTDGIYPDWALFMRTISEPSNIKQEHFVEQQEAKQKDVEHCYSVHTPFFNNTNNILKLIFFFVKFCSY